VNHGDLLHGDANGVSSIPLEIASEVAEIGDEFVALEAIIMDYVKGREPKVVSKYEALRKEFQASAAKLQQRVSRRGRAAGG